MRELRSTKICRSGIFSVTEEHPAFLTSRILFPMCPPSCRIYELVVSRGAKQLRADNLVQRSTRLGRYGELGVEELERVLGEGPAPGRQTERHLPAAIELGYLGSFLIGRLVEDLRQESNRKHAWGRIGMIIVLAVRGGKLFSGVQLMRRPSCRSHSRPGFSADLLGRYRRGASAGGVFSCRPFEENSWTTRRLLHPE